MVLVRNRSNSSIGGQSSSSSTSSTSSYGSLGGRASATSKSKRNEQRQDQPTEDCLNIPCQSLDEFAKYIPVRLNERERSLLAVLESTLQVSEYTDNVDVAVRRGNKARRVLEGILEGCNISTGLAVCGMADDYVPCSNAMVVERRRRKLSIGMSKKKNGKKKEKKAGKGEEEGEKCTSLAGRDAKENAAFFQEICEIGRRNKVLNPSKMRDTYGKLMHLLQDAQSPTVARSLGFSLHKELVMVRPFLKAFSNDLAKKLLSDPRLIGATMHVQDRDSTTGNKISRDDINKKIAKKHQLKYELIEEYSTNFNIPTSTSTDPSSANFTKEDLTRCIDSISDALAVIQSNLAPVKRMLRLLEDNFHPSVPTKPFSLQLSSSLTSSSSSYSTYSRYSFPSLYTSTTSTKLSHSHPTQYTFVWQSLKLWCEVQKNMHRLWVCADDDLLSTSSSYQLWNTGQGLNRVQSCPKVSKLMRSLLTHTQHAAKAPWVGLSVIHLGDRDVPNALVFIDKYTQIPRFLQPIVDFIDAIPSMTQHDPHFQTYVEKQFGSAHNLKMTVLTDYFKHGFDGSGDDGGSCIDGRLTSSWNWTSRIAKKSYYHALMLSGFQGFDGDFK